MDQHFFKSGTNVSVCLPNCGMSCVFVGRVHKDQLFRSTVQTLSPPVDSQESWGIHCPPRECCMASARVPPVPTATGVQAVHCHRFRHLVCDRRCFPGSPRGQQRMHTYMAQPTTLKITPERLEAGIGMWATVPPWSPHLRVARVPLSMHVLDHVASQRRKHRTALDSGPRAQVARRHAARRRWRA